MTIAHFKPTYWSKILLGSLEKSLVFGSPYVINHDYEGEIANSGDSVNITSIADPTVSDYVPNTNINYESPNDAGLTLLIDQAKYFAVQIDDIDAAQAAGNMLTFMQGRAGYKVRDRADQFVAGFYTSASPTNSVGTSGAPIAPAVYSPTNPADFYTKVVLPLGVKLDEANVEDDGGRYMVMPPWCKGLLKQTAAFVQFPNATGGPGSVMTNGAFGMIDNMTILISNNAVNYSGSNWIVQAGHNSAITFADQIVKTEALRLQTRFADAVRGMHVYGARVIRPEALAVGYVTRPAGI